MTQLPKVEARPKMVLFREPIEEMTQYHAGLQETLETKIHPRFPWRCKCTLDNGRYFHIHHSDNFPPWYHYSGQRFYMKFIKYWFDGLEYLSEYNTWYGDFEIHVFLLWSVLSIFFFCVSLLALHRKFINEINFRNIYKKGWQMFMVNILILNIYSFGNMSWIFPRVGYMLISHIECWIITPNINLILSRSCYLIYIIIRWTFSKHDCIFNVWKNFVKVLPLAKLGKIALFIN